VLCQSTCRWPVPLHVVLTAVATPARASPRALWSTWPAV
jgi:hypothetical protein